MVLIQKAQEKIQDFWDYYAKELIQGPHIEMFASDSKEIKEEVTEAF